MNKNSQSSRSICQRLINFVVSAMNHAPVTIEEGSPRNKTGLTKRPEADAGSEIVVEFWHIGSGGWIDINKQEGYSVLGSKKGGGLMSSNGGKTINIDHFANYENDHKNNRARDDTKPRSLLSVASNINEKSDEYIKNRKKAMNRSYSFD